MSATKVSTRCPKCDKALRVDPQLMGKTVRCPGCQHRFVVSGVNFSLGGEAREASQSIEALETRMGAGGSDTSAGGTPAPSARIPPDGLLGRFELREVLGRGGFGIVYRAYDPLLEREVALKVPLFSSAEKQKAQRFLNEARAAARLRHPNIVACYEIGEAGEKLFLAAEYIKGQTLAELLKKSGRPSIEQAVEWVQQLASALEYAHSQGIVHRDIKPQNVMIDGTGKPQIMDFGLAKRLNQDSTMTVEGALIGTPAYMPPEQAKGEIDKIGPRSDQYSLGVVLYELLTGKKPFEGSASVAIARLLSEDPVPPSEHNSAIPTALEAICLKAMSKQIEDRYASIMEMARELDEFQSKAAELDGVPDRSGAANLGTQHYFHSGSRLRGTPRRPALRRDLLERLPQPLRNPRNLGITGGAIGGFIALAIIFTALSRPAQVSDGAGPNANRADANDKKEDFTEASAEPQPAKVSDSTLYAPSLVSGSQDAPVPASSETSARAPLPAVAATTTGVTKMYPPNDTPWIGDDHVTWEVLDPQRYESLTDATITKLADRSLLVAGNVGPPETYVITAETDLEQITGLRLEMLKDPSLNQGGPGRQFWPHGGFELAEISVQAGERGRPVLLTSHPVRDACADYSESDHSIRNLVEGAAPPSSAGWAIYEPPLLGHFLMAPHIAIFEIDSTSRTEQGTVIKVRLGTKNARPLGRFRLSVTDGRAPASPYLDPDGSQRQIAEWLIMRGGAVEVVLRNGVQQRIDAISMLPGEAFRIRGIDTQRAGEPLGASNVGRVAKCTDLCRLIVDECDDSSLTALKACGQLQSIVLRRANVSRTGLGALAQIPDLWSLGITDSSLSGRDALAHVGTFERLRVLSLARTPLAGIDLEAVSKLFLLGLDLSETGIGDGALAPWATSGGGGGYLTLSGARNNVTASGLAALNGRFWSIDLSNSSVGDAELAVLQEDDSFVNVNLSFTRITSGGLSKFVERKKVASHLYLAGTAISSASLKGLSNLQQLGYLDLSQTQVDDRAITHLKKIPTLKWIGLLQTRLSEAGVTELRQSLPKCDVQFSAAPDKSLESSRQN